MGAGTTFSVAEFASTIMADRVYLGLTYFPVYVPRGDQHSIVLNKPADSDARSALTIKAKTKNPRVVITAHMEESMSRKDINEFENSVRTGIPRAVNMFKITLEGLHSSINSTVLTLNLPAAVWLQLPGDEEAYTFVAHVESFTSSAQEPVEVPNSPVFIS